MLQSQLLTETVQFSGQDTILVLNSASDAFVTYALPRLQNGTLLLAEDNISTLPSLAHAPRVRHMAFHDYILHDSYPASDVAVMNLLYQPANVWMWYGLEVAARSLKPGGRFYVAGAKDRGILSMAKRMQETFGMVETVVISKGHRVLCATKGSQVQTVHSSTDALRVFADSKLDEGTRQLLSALDVNAADRALDIGCGAGFIGLHIARLANQGHVTMLDTSLAAVAAAQQAADEAHLSNVSVLASDGVQAVQKQKFSLIATNPPFHQGGIQTLEIAERFIRGAAGVLQPQGHFYLVANRFLKYEPILNSCFAALTEVAGDTRYKVLRASHPRHA